MRKPRNYTMDRLCFDLSRHLWRGYLALHGPDHHLTRKFARHARRDAGYLIAAGMA